MNIFKHITWFRTYLALCILCVSAYSYAEYYGYAFKGADDDKQSRGLHGSSGHYNSSPHHK